jgi:hypothetical protein
VDIVLFSYFLERSQFKTDYLKLFHVAAQHGSEINILMMITNFIKNLSSSHGFNLEL